MDFGLENLNKWECVWLVKEAGVGCEMMCLLKICCKTSWKKTCF